jgi:hypothetical protein
LVVAAGALDVELDAVVLPPAEPPEPPEPFEALELPEVPEVPLPADAPTAAGVRAGAALSWLVRPERESVR